MVRLLELKGAESLAKMIGYLIWPNVLPGCSVWCIIMGPSVVTKHAISQKEIKVSFKENLDQHIFP